MSTTEPRRETAPTLQGRYRLVRTLEANARGANFLGYDLRLHRWRMIEVPADEEASQNLLREAELLARLEHPAVERVIDVGDDGPISFVVRDRLYGSVAEHLPLSPSLTASVILRIADGLAHAHARGIFHGHVRPSMVRFSEEGTPVLVGFGRATRLDGATTARVAEPWAHLSPEMRQHWEPSVPSEIYALAAMLYTLLAGRHQADLFYAEAYDGLLAPVPGALRPIILRGCAYDPNDRPVDVETFRAMLAARVEMLGTPGEPPWKAEPLPDRPPDQVVPDAPLLGLIALLGPRPPTASARRVESTDSASTLNSEGAARLPYAMPQIVRKDPGFRDPFEDESEADVPGYVDATWHSTPTPRPIRAHIDRLSSTNPIPPERPEPPPPRVPLLLILIGLTTLATAGAGVLMMVAWLALAPVRSEQALVDAVLAERAAAEVLASTSADRPALEEAWFRFADAPTAEHAAAYVQLAIVAGHAETAPIEAQRAVERMEQALHHWEGH